MSIPNGVEHQKPAKSKTPQTNERSAPEEPQPVFKPATADKDPIWGWIVAITVTVLAIGIVVVFSLLWTVGERGKILKPDQVVAAVQSQRIPGIGVVEPGSVSVLDAKTYSQRFVVDDRCATYLQPLADSVPPYVEATINKSDSLPSDAKIDYGVFVSSNRKTADNLWGYLEETVDKHCYGGNWGNISVHEGGERSSIDGAQYFWRRIGSYDTDDVYGYLLMIRWGNTTTSLVISSEQGEFSIDVEAIVKAVKNSFDT